MLFWFWKKNRKKDKKFLTFLLIPLIVSVFFIFYYIFKVTVVNSSDIVVSTDKRRYKEKEVVKISVFNKKSVPIFLKRRLDRVWDINISQNSEWLDSKGAIFGESGRYLLEDKDVSSEGKCGSGIKVSYTNQFMDSGARLLPGGGADFEWDQRGCLVSSQNYENYAKTAVRGIYRVVLEYHYDVIGEGGSVVTEKGVVYSNPFYLK